MGPLRPRQVWGAGVLVAAVALLGIVAVSAQDEPLVAPDASDSLDLGSGGQSALFALLGLAVVGGIVIVVVSLLSQRRAKPIWRRSHTWVVWLLAIAIGFVAYLVIRPGDRPQVKEPVPDNLPSSGGERIPGLAPAPPWALLVLGGIVVGALAAAVVAGRRLSRADEPDAVITDDVLHALDASVSDLEASGDPRAAIIAAYARLLDAFERCGLGRRPSETPLEHLRRGLDALPIRAEPAERLTQLFLEARFSTHDLGETERRDALAAFVAARDDLQAQVQTQTSSIGVP